MKMVVITGSAADTLMDGDNGKVSAGVDDAATRLIKVEFYPVSAALQSADPAKKRVIYNLVEGTPAGDYTNKQVKVTLVVPDDVDLNTVEIVVWNAKATPPGWVSLPTNHEVLNGKRTAWAIVPHFTQIALAKKLATGTPTVTPKPSNFKPLASTVKKGGGKAKNTYLGVMIGALVLLGLVCIVGFVSWRRTVVAARPIDAAFTQMHVNAQPNPNSAHTWLLASSRRSNSNV
jgi:hypothetical protein